MKLLLLPKKGMSQIFIYVSRYGTYFIFCNDVCFIYCITRSSWYTPLAFIKLSEWLLLRFNLTLSESALSILDVWSWMNGSEKKESLQIIFASWRAIVSTSANLSISTRSWKEEIWMIDNMQFAKEECFLSKIATP